MPADRQIVIPATRTRGLISASGLVGAAHGLLLLKSPEVLDHLTSAALANGYGLNVIVPVVCALLAVKRQFLPTAFGPLDFLYPVLFIGMGTLCLVFAALLRWTRWRWIPLVATLLLMAFAVTLTWVDANHTLVTNPNGAVANSQRCPG